jgi:RNA polymerase sigma-70 factor, ECF subfamily
MDIDVAISKLKSGQGNVDELTLATLDIIFERTPDMQVVIEAAAVPHWFDVSILSRLLDIDTCGANMQFERLLALPVVEAFPARKGCNVHEATRLALRKRLHRDDPQRFQLLAQRAFSCFGDDDNVSKVEAIYHGLNGSPDTGAVELRELWRRWTDEGRHEWLHSLYLVIVELLSGGQLAPAPRARALLCQSASPHGRMRLTDAESCAREAATILTALEREQDEVDARTQLGEILLRKGESNEALAQYDRCSAILKRTPESEEQQYHLWLTFCLIGRALRVQDRSAEALENHELALAIACRHLEQKPGDIVWRQRLSTAHDDIGLVLHMQSKLPDAVAAYESSRRILEELVQSDSENSSWQCSLARCHRQVGAVLLVQRKPPEALAAYRQGRTVIRKLLERDGDNPEWSYEESVLCNGTAEALQAQGDLDAALMEYEAALRIQCRLSEGDSGNTVWQWALARTHGYIASVLSRLEKHSAALAAATTSRDILVQLTKIDPANARWRLDRFEAHRAVGDLLQVEGRTARAVQEFDASVPFAPLDDRWAESYRKARLTWPSVVVAPDDFGRHCERVLGTSPEWDWKRFGNELYLCCACFRGDVEATRVLESDVLPQVVKAISRIDSNTDFVEEALQSLHEKLFAGPRAKIGDYAARGPLVAWLSVAAARVALDLIRAKNMRKLQHADLPDRLAQTDSSPLNDIVTSQYADSFQRALKHAISSLPSRERNLLRLQLVGRCSIDQLGRMYLVHRATAARWLEGARNRVFESVREQMKLEHRLTDGEFDSIARGVRSQLDLAITATINEFTEHAADADAAPASEPSPELSFESEDAD